MLAGGGPGEYVDAHAGEALEDACNALIVRVDADEAERDLWGAGRAWDRVGGGSTEERASEAEERGVGFGFGGAVKGIRVGVDFTEFGDDAVVSDAGAG